MSENSKVQVHSCWRTTNSLTNNTPHTPPAPSLHTPPPRVSRTRRKGVGCEGHRRRTSPHLCIGNLAFYPCNVHTRLSLRVLLQLTTPACWPPRNAMDTLAQSARFCHLPSCLLRRLLGMLVSFAHFRSLPLEACYTSRLLSASTMLACHHCRPHARAE